MKLAIFIALAGLSAPLVAQEAPAPEAKPADKKICRMVEQTGSILLRKKYCLTRAEWAQFNRYTEDRASRAMDQRGLGTNKGFNKE